MAWRYLRGNKGTEQPANHVVVDTETEEHDIPGQPRRKLLTLRLGVAVAWRMEGGHQTRRKELVFSQAQDFWTWLMALTEKNRPLWLWGHNVGFDLTVLKLWELVEHGTIQLQRYVGESPPTILRGYLGRGRLHILDSRNFWRCSLRDLGRSVRRAKGTYRESASDSALLLAYCRNDARILETAVLSLMLFARNHDLGRFRDTAAGTAIQAYRHRFHGGQRADGRGDAGSGDTLSTEVRGKRIVFHDDAAVKTLERRAYFGGEHRCFYVGRVLPESQLDHSTAQEITNAGDYYRIGPVYVLDVNSLYPSVMAGREYPCRLLRHIRTPTVAELTDLGKHYEIVASVKIDTEDAYPLRADGGRVRYCTGVFWTTTCAAQLRQLLLAGRVLACDEAAVYETADLFSEYVSYFYQLKQRYRSEGNTAWADLCKLMLNGLYGKFGAQSWGWESRPNVQSPIPWGVWHDLIMPGKEHHVYRSIGWHTQEKMPKGEMPDSFPAISACVTANARERMRHYRSLVGEPYILYQGDDSLHCTREGFDRAERFGLLGESRLGGLRHIATIGTSAYRGVKDYTHDGKDVIAGVKKGAASLAENEYEQLDVQQLASVIAARPADGIVKQHTKYYLERKSVGGVVGPFGVVAPYHLTGR